MAEKAEDLNLPLTVVSRIIKDALPDGVNVSKEAKIAIARAASVFVLYATTTANSYATKAKRKTLAATDIMEAMKDMEFEELVQPLNEALQVWKQGVKPKKVKIQQLKSTENDVANLENVDSFEIAENSTNVDVSSTENAKNLETVENMEIAENSESDGTQKNMNGEEYPAENEIDFSNNMQQTETTIDEDIS